MKVNKQQFLQAMEILASNDQLILQAARRIPEDKHPQIPGGVALEFVVAMGALRENVVQA